MSVVCCRRWPNSLKRTKHDSYGTRHLSIREIRPRLRDQRGVAIELSLLMFRSWECHPTRSSALRSGASVPPEKSTPGKGSLLTMVRSQWSGCLNEYRQAADWLKAIAFA